MTQGFNINSYTVLFHDSQHPQQRHFHFEEKLLQPVTAQFSFQYLLQLKGDIGIFGCIIAQPVQIHTANILLVFAFTGEEILVMDGTVLQINFGQVIHSVTQFGLQQIVSYHCIEHIPP